MGSLKKREREEEEFYRGLGGNEGGLRGQRGQGRADLVQTDHSDQHTPIHTHARVRTKLWQASAQTEDKKKNRDKG